MDTHHFNTPPNILERVRLLSPDGQIGLDPCSNTHSKVEARVEWMGTHGLDGLAQSWRGLGLVFMNPPHSMSPNNIEPWIEKAYTEFIKDGLWGVSGTLRSLRDQFVGLIPAKTDTAWFHNYVKRFDRRVFLQRRPKYWLNGAPMPGAGKFASMLIYAGHQPAKFSELFASWGWAV